jgi:hypothetical protein
MSKTKLVPPDPKRCQFEDKPGSFMTFGPRKWVRCQNKPIYIAHEVKPREDGQKGSMSLCNEHAEHMIKAFGIGYALLELVKKPKKSKKRK